MGLKQYLLPSLNRRSNVPWLQELPKGAAIPKILHQTYPSAELPRALDENVAKIKRLNPGWEYRFYDDTAVVSFIRGNFSDRIFRQFNRINPRYGAARADLFRYLLMYKVGGVYLDIKSSATRSLDDVLLPDDEFVLSQWEHNLDKRHQRWGLHKEVAGIKGGEFQQWHIVCVPGHPFLKAVIERVLRNIDVYNPALHGTGRGGVLRCTGPIAYTLAVAPLLERHRYRLVRAISDLGFQYSVFQPSSGQSHRDLFSSHYSMLAESIVNLDPLGRGLAGGIRVLRKTKRVLFRKAPRP